MFYEDLRTRELAGLTERVKERHIPILQPKDGAKLQQTRVGRIRLLLMVNVAYFQIELGSSPGHK